MPVQPELAAGESLRAAGIDAVLATLARKARPGERPEDLLLDLGLLPDRDFALELARRSEREFVGLRGFLPDERLFLYLPLPLAVRERVCPLVLVGDSLKLASAFPDPGLDSVARTFPNLALDVAIAPRGEILEALEDVARSVRGV